MFASFLYLYLIQLRYYRSAESAPTQCHVYSYSIKAKEKQCLTCGLIQGMIFVEDCKGFYLERIKSIHKSKKIH